MVGHPAVDDAVETGKHPGRPAMGACGLVVRSIGVEIEGLPRFQCFISIHLFVEVQPCLQWAQK